MYCICMRCFINLPLAWAVADPSWFEWFAAQAKAPEWGLDQESLALPESAYRETARRLREYGLACTVHLPFMGLDPAGPDPEKRREAFETIKRGAQLAERFAARLMVGHPGFTKNRDGTGAFCETLNQAWLERSRVFWNGILEASATPLCLENIYETSPAVLPAILEGLASPRAGICLDIGHWHVFALGVERRDLPVWLKAYAPHIRHLHLHDNHGATDEHLGLGQGGADIGLLLRLLREQGLSPTATLEAHSIKAFTDSDAWFQEHPEEARQVGWTPLQRKDLPFPKTFFQKTPSA